MKKKKNNPDLFHFLNYKFGNIERRLTKIENDIKWLKFIIQFLFALIVALMGLLKIV